MGKGFSTGSLEKTKPLTVAGQGFLAGGGGGTVDPHLSMRPGLCLHPTNRVRGVLSNQSHDWILVLARHEARRAYESLQGSPAVGPLATPRRYQDTNNSFAGAVRVRRCEPRFHFAVTRKGDQYLIEPASASPTFRALHAYSAIDLAMSYPTDREDP